jgi:predicted alpha/beta superfamily hydrolase
VREAARPLTPLGATEVHDVWSEEVQDRFRLFIGYCGEHPDVTLFVTDANGLFGLAVDTVRLMQIPALLPSMLVVGIGYPHADTVVDTLELRTRDFTPTTTSAPFHSGGGGGPAFLRFLRRELFPWVEQRVPSCLAESIYFGHSLGGLFGVYALLDDSPAFDHFVISSPSLWWDGRVIFEHEERRAKEKDDLAAHVYIGIGADETDEGRRVEAANLPDGHQFKPPSIHLDMVDDVVRFAEALGSREYGSLDLHVEVHPHEFHATVASTVLSRGLRRLVSNL